MPLASVFRLKLFFELPLGLSDYLAFASSFQCHSLVPFLKEQNGFLRIKYYEKSEMIELDRKFTDECGMTATYDLPIDFE